MADYTASVDYSLDNGVTYKSLYTNYTGDISHAAFNQLLPISGSRSVKFRTYKTSEIIGTPPSDTQYIYAGGTHLQLTSYYSLNEYKYMCVVEKGEFQDSSNHTLYDDSGSLKGRTVYTDTAGSSSVFEIDENFKPLATGIGLYDDSNVLIAIGKFANPIRIEKDLDSVFIIKFDV